MKRFACSIAIVLLLSTTAIACGPGKDGKPKDITLTKANQYDTAKYTFIMAQTDETMTGQAQPARPKTESMPAKEPAADNPASGSN